jgi:hypothetical protein
MMVVATSQGAVFQFQPAKSAPSFNVTFDTFVTAPFGMRLVKLPTIESPECTHRWMGPPTGNPLAERGISVRRESAIIAAVGAGTFVLALQVAELLVALLAMASFLRAPYSAEWATWG